MSDFAEQRQEDRAAWESNASTLRRVRALVAPHARPGEHLLETLERLLAVTNSQPASDWARTIDALARAESERDSAQVHECQHREQLAAALDALDMIAPRPWEAVAEDVPENDEGEWSLYDANGERITSSWGPKDGQTNGAWARGTCEAVNGLDASGE